MKCEQVWSDEASVQIKFERAGAGTVRITRIVGDSKEGIVMTIRGWRWDRVVEKMAEPDNSEPADNSPPK